jgi:hypothetical protein
MSLFDGVISAVGNAFGSVSGPEAALLGGVVGAAGNYFGTQSQNQASAQQASEMRRFQADMSNTAYQRAVKDMQAAGLNPMLAYSQGGATTPAGAMAQMQNVLGNATTSGTQAYQTVAQANQAIQQTKQIAAQTELTDNQTDNVRADTLNKLDENPNIKAQYKQILADTFMKNEIGKTSSAQAAQALAQSRYSDQLTRLARSGSAPSSQRPIYQDIKNLAKDAYSGSSAQKWINNYRGQPIQQNRTNNQPPME